MEPIISAVLKYKPNKNIMKLIISPIEYIKFNFILFYMVNISKFISFVWLWAELYGKEYKYI